MTSRVPYVTSTLKALCEGHPRPLGWDSVRLGAGTVVTALRVASLGALAPDLEVNGRGFGSRGVPLAVRLLSGVLQPFSDSGFSETPVELFVISLSRSFLVVP